MNNEAEQLRMYLHLCTRVFCARFSILDPKTRANLIQGRRCLRSQVYSHGLRVIVKGQPPQEWRAPGKKQIEKACANERQVVLALAGGEIIFFELDEAMQNIQASTACSAQENCLLVCSDPAWYTPRRTGLPLGLSLS